jgi:hypothetical protein
MLSCSPVYFLWNDVKFMVIDATLVDLLSKSGTAKIMWFIYGDVFFFANSSRFVCRNGMQKSPQKNTLDKNPRSTITMYLSAATNSTPVWRCLFNSSEPSERPSWGEDVEGGSLSRIAVIISAGGHANGVKHRIMFGIKPGDRLPTHEE